MNHLHVILNRLTSSGLQLYTQHRKSKYLVCPNWILRTFSLNNINMYVNKNSNKSKKNLHSKIKHIFTYLSINTKDKFSLKWWMKQFNMNENDSRNLSGFCFLCSIFLGGWWWWGGQTLFQSFQNVFSGCSVLSNVKNTHNTQISHIISQGIS